MYVYKEVLLQQLSSFSYPYHPMIPLLDYWNIFSLVSSTNKHNPWATTRYHINNYIRV